MTNTVPVILVDDEGSDKSKVIHKARIIYFSECANKEACWQICEGEYCYRLLCNVRSSFPYFVDLDERELTQKLATGYRFCKRCERRER